MKTAYLLLFLGLAACTSKVEQHDAASNRRVADSVTVAEEKESAPTATMRHSNARFREVMVKKSGENKYTVSGEGQLYEGTLEWVVEDGHNELAEGFTTTDAGAPEWGSFEFTVEVEKQRENSTLMLVIFETSAEDGSRRHELSVKLD